MRMIVSMKYLIFIMLFSPVFVFAHTSDERYVDGYIVDLSTAPIAPWVGEKMGMSFVFRDALTGRATTSVVSAQMEIDALLRANGKAPEVIFSNTVPYVVHEGGFTIDYAFQEEGTFDMHLTFLDSSGREHLAGFRKQVRTGELASTSAHGLGISPLVFFGTILAVSTLGFVAGRLWVKNSDHR